jgi:transposase
MARYELTDEEWERIAPLLPPTHPDKPGRPWTDHRQVLNGILWILRTGAPWEDLPERYPPKSTCNDRLRRWKADGTWDRILQTLQAQADQDNNVVWVEDALDATIVRAHQHAAGARRQKKRAQSGRTEIHVVWVGDRHRLRRRRFLRPRSVGTQPRRANEQTASVGGWPGPPSGAAFDGRSGT